MSLEGVQDIEVSSYDAPPSLLAVQAAHIDARQSSSLVFTMPHMSVEYFVSRWGAGLSELGKHTEFTDSNGGNRFQSGAVAIEEKIADYVKMLMDEKEAGLHVVGYSEAEALLGILDVGMSTTGA